MMSAVCRPSCLALRGRGGGCRRGFQPKAWLGSLGNGHDLPQRRGNALLMQGVALPNHPELEMLVGAEFRQGAELQLVIRRDHLKFQVMRNQQQVRHQMKFGKASSQAKVRTQPERRESPRRSMFGSIGKVAVDVKLPGVLEILLHVVRSGMARVNGGPRRNLHSVDLDGVHRLSQLQRNDRVQTHRFHDEPMRNVDCFACQVLLGRIAIREQGVRLRRDLFPYIGILQQFIERKRNRAPHIVPRNQRRHKNTCACPQYWAT